MKLNILGESDSPPSPGDYQKPGGYNGVEKELQQKGYRQTGGQTLTVQQVVQFIGGEGKVPYLKDVIELYSDPSAEDRDWMVYKKIIEYHNYLKKNPQTVKNLPPIIIADKQLKDGAHRLSALNLLARTSGQEWLKVPLKVRMWAKDV